MSPLCTQFSDIFRATTGKNCTVAECYGGGRWNWGRILRGIPPTRQHSGADIRKMKDLLSGLSPSRGTDTLRWRWDPAEAFSVRTTYTFLQDGGVKVVLFDKLWGTKAPLKVKIFIWTALKDRILTKDNLSVRGWTGDVITCVFCGVAIETVNHLLAECTAIKALLGAQLLFKRHLCNSSTVLNLWKFCCSPGGSLGRRERSIIFASWWSIWLERNRRIFENNSSTVKQLLGSTRTLRHLWLSFCP